MTDNVRPFIPSKEKLFTVMPACDLLAKEFGELHWNIQGILPAGSMLLSGKPKKGKSFLSLMVAICVAAGRPVFGKETSGRPVLYLALEDSERRLKRRLIGCANSLVVDPNEYSQNLHLSTESKRIDNGLIEDLRGFLTAFDDCGLIVVDMLKMVTGANKPGAQLYEIQGEVGQALTKLCHEHPDLSILVVHHSRKTDSEDPFDQISGTTGLTGSYDSLAVITETEGCRVLHTTGRDIEGAEMPLLMNERGMYTLEMPTEEEMVTATMSDTRRQVFDAVPAGSPYMRKDIAEGCGLDDNIVAQQLLKLVRDGLVKKSGYGRYQKTGKRWYDEPVHEDY